MTRAQDEFAWLLNAKRMQALFQQKLPSHLTRNWLITGCEIQHPRFKTYLNPASYGKSTLALAYHLAGVNTETQRAENRIIYTKAFLAGRSYEVYREACQVPNSLEQHRIIHLPEDNLVAWLFPCDPVMAWLPEVLAESHIRHLINLGVFDGAESAIGFPSAVQTRVVNYRPEIRCTCRHDLFGNAPSANKTVYSKTYAGELGKEVFRRMSLFHQSLVHDKDAFVIPRPLHYEDRTRTCWLEGLTGKLLLEVIEQANSGEFIGRLAHALADFHALQINGLHSISEDELQAEIEKKLTKLAKAFPQWQTRLFALLRALDAERVDLPQTPATLIHGDFHIQQLLLLADERLALFDYDELAYGHPLIDVANFCADLYTHPLNEVKVGQLIESFLNNYRKFCAADLNVKQFNWHLRIQLLTRAYRAHIQQKPEQEAWIGKFLKIAEKGYRPEETTNHVA